VCSYTSTLLCGKQRENFTFLSIYLNKGRILHERFC